MKFNSLDELHEVYIFGQNFGFEVFTNHPVKPHISTNEGELDLDNVDKLFNLLKHDGAIFLPLALKSIEI